MARKRPKQSKIDIDFVPKVCSTKEDKPSCFGSWADYCMKQLCGESCFEECKKEARDD